MGHWDCFRRIIVMSEGSGSTSTAGDDTSSNRPIGDANKETNRDTSGTTEEESSDVLTPSVNTTTQSMSKRGVRSKQSSGCFKIKDPVFNIESTESRVDSPVMRQLKID